MIPTLEEFAPLLRENDAVQGHGNLLQVYPKADFGRTAISQFLLGLVGGVIAVVCLVVSFQVVVSNVPAEQRPFQQAMWGFAAVGGILMFYGIGSGVWRQTNGLAQVGRWWLLFERRFVILNHGEVEWAGPLEAIDTRSSGSIGSSMKLTDETGRTLAMPLKNGDEMILAILNQLQEAGRGDGKKPSEPDPYALGWAEAKWFGDDQVFRIYPDGPSILLVFAGQLVPEKIGTERIHNRIPGVVGVAGTAMIKYRDWVLGEEFDTRARYLDALSMEQLRKETRHNSASGEFTAENATEVSIGTSTDTLWGLDLLKGEPTTQWKFRLNRKKWELNFLSPEEASLVQEAVIQILGPDAVTIVE